MKHGPAWIIFEESLRHGSKELISILPPRRPVHDVVAFMEQIYIDRTASLLERLRYKKSRDSAAYSPQLDGHVMHCGHDPFLVGIYAFQTCVKDGVLEFHYRIITTRAQHPKDCVFEERSQSLRVDA